MQRKILGPITAFVLAASLPAFAQSERTPDGGEAMGTNAMDTDKGPTPAPQDVKTAADFVPLAAVGNSFEIETSNLALTKSTDEAVREFARRMNADHSEAAVKLQQAVEQSKSGLAIPTGLDARHQELLNELSAADDGDFDAEYVAMQRQAHEEAVALFSAYSTNGEDGPIKEMAASTLPTLKEHQQMVGDLGK
ncbi:DUF4142 domain-containing protein [Jiella mangrovi]|uniref:DUF4142 domain-containing protein n=1 Tax=Jiella mangrovi TaxID=2821407 RepID=A0ABS4BLA1_9HYPH|nr:DUF4142 domain-containing protein [Jiella mangrovi]MBP0616940.1 DUF4142 domain-containing protein [Jiella mangrovi]